MTKTKNGTWEMALHTRNNPLANQLGALMYANRHETGDITFKVGSKEIKAHKSVLAAFSPKYMAQFYTDFNFENPVEVKDVTSAAFEEFLQFFYLDLVDLTYKNIADVLTLTAESVEAFFDECISFLTETLTVENVCLSYYLAAKYEKLALMECCERKISIDSDEVFLSDAFLSCTPDVVFNILQVDSLSCKENVVFDACILWAKNRCSAQGLDSNNMDDVRKVLTDDDDKLPGKLLHQIRFGAMSIEEFSASCYKNYKELFTEDERDEIIFMIGKVNDSEPKRFNDESRDVPYRKWDEEGSVECNRIFAENPLESFYFGLTKTEFFSDRPVLLGGFYCGSLFESKSVINEKCVTTNVSIIRKHALGDKDGKIWLNKVEKLTFKPKEEAYVKLERSIMIRPNFVYEIHLDFKEGFSVKSYEFNKEVILGKPVLTPKTLFGLRMSEPTKDEFESGSRTVIKFSETQGIVTSLKLNLCFD